VNPVSRSRARRSERGAAAVERSRSRNGTRLNSLQWMVRLVADRRRRTASLPGRHGRIRCPGRHETPINTGTRVNYPALPRSGLLVPRLLRARLPGSVSELASKGTAVLAFAGGFPSLRKRWGVSPGLIKNLSFYATECLVRQCRHVYQLQRGCRNISLRASRSRTTQTYAPSKTGSTISSSTARMSPLRILTPARVSRLNQSRNRVVGP